MPAPNPLIHNTQHQAMTQNVSQKLSLPDENCHSLPSRIMKPALPAPLHPGQQGTKCESFSFNPGGWGFFELGQAGYSIETPIFS